jgi:DNA-binding beta-propeller fold protein YncE
VTIDPVTRRAFVSLFEAHQVAVLEPVDEPPFYEQVATLESGPFPRWLAVDPDTGRLLVSNDGQPETAIGDLENGSVAMFDARADVPRPLAEPVPASVPSGITFDPLSGNAFVLENGSDELMTLDFPAGGGAPTVSRIPVDPYVDEGQNVNPIDLVFLPATRELIATQANRSSPIGGHLDVLRVDDSGRPSLSGTIASAMHTSGIALDPVTGRVFVSAVQEGRLTALDEDEPSAPPPPPAPIAVSMPSPLQVSFAPEDVARTVGISLLVLLLVGAPTPIFNETLEANLGEIQGGLRRLVPGGRGSTSRWQGMGARLERFSASRLGLAVYIVLAAVIYSFLTPGFPGSDAAVVLGVAVLAIAAATAADTLPGQRYVIGHYADRGRIRVAIWTLGLAAICVLISRLGDLQPGYMYGIIGTFTFVALLSVADEGRMEARGAVALLILALVVWVLRIPFQPAPGVPASGTDLTINLGLVGVFVVAVEGLVFGLVPLNFLPGQKIWAWSRWRWLLLWGAGLALFIHVLVYPVTVAQPEPSASSLTTTLISVAIYGAIAVGFWLFFRWRNARRAAAEVTGPAAATAIAVEDAVAGTELVPEPDVDPVAPAPEGASTLAVAIPEEPSIPEKPSIPDSETTGGPSDGSDPAPEAPPGPRRTRVYDRRTKRTPPTGGSTSP